MSKHCLTGPPPSVVPLLHPSCEIAVSLQRSAQKVSSLTGKGITEAASQIASRALHLYQEELSAISNARSVAESLGLTLAELLNERLAA